MRRLAILLTTMVAAATLLIGSGAGIAQAAQTLTVDPTATLLVPPLVPSTRVRITGTYTCDSGQGSVSVLLRQGSTFSQGGTQVTCTGTVQSYTVFVIGPFTVGAATATVTLSANAQQTQVQQTITIV